LLARAVLLIPHFIAAYVMLIVVELLQLVIWIPVLTSGNYPDFARGLVVGTLQWWTRITAYAYGLTDKYPPFSLASDPSYPVNITVQWQPSYNRLFAIPIVGLVIRAVLLIPHIIVLYVLNAVVGILQLILWAFVLFTGQYPDWGQSLVGGYLRWQTRVSCYMLGISDVYPPFQLGN
jgi:hypothetical protein